MLMICRAGIPEPVVAANPGSLKKGPLSMTLWKINCMEGEFPGLWQQWYRHQCVAVGFGPFWGLKLHGKTKDYGGWHTARAALLRIEVGIT